VSWK
jgi:hypothetical protein